MCTAYLVRILNFEIIDGYDVYTEEVTNESFFNLNYNSMVTDIFREYGEYIDDGATGALLYLTKEGLKTYLDYNGVEGFSDDELLIINRIQSEIEQSPFDIVCFDCY